MKKDITNIIKKLRGLNSKLQKEFNVDTLEVFGSYAKRKANSKSDLDILVTFKKHPSLLEFIKLENFISDKLGIKVDLVMKTAIKPCLKNSILNNAISV